MVKVSEFTAKPPYILGNFPRIEINFVCAEEQNPSDNIKTKNKYEKLSQLKVLLDNGAFSKEEFKIEKKKILSED
jgi:hypothetical protein